MKTRMKMAQVDPEAYKTMSAFHKYLRESPLQKTHYDLIFVFSSMLNGCAYCIQDHTKDALANGETPKRLFALNAWKESPYFDEKERAILALTEEITFISKEGVTDKTYDDAIELLGESYIAVVIMAINTINAWNRIGISTRMMPA